MLLAKLLSIVFITVIAAVLILGAMSGLTVGHPQVLDGDTLQLDETIIRLYGIRAPGREQHCRWVEREWDCGEAARKALQEKIATRVVRCLPKGKDGAQAVLAVCYLGTQDLNRWMVQQGWALASPAHSDRYVGAQEQALNELQGIWSSQFSLPQD